MITVYLEDQPGGVAVVLRDANVAPYYPPATVGAAWVRLYARDKGKGVDTAFVIAEGKPGGEFSIPYAALTGRDMQFATVTLSPNGTPSVSDLDHADWQELAVGVNAGTAAGIDEHVPTVTKEPSVALVGDGFDEWAVFTPAPDAYGATLTDGEIWVEKADDADVFEVWPIAVSPYTRIPQKPYACTVYYRWRNQSSEDAGDGRGWSEWSPGAAAAELGASSPPPPIGGSGGVLDTFVFDEEDSRAGIQRGVVSSE